jgi:FixJ family two-component response regulator
LVDDDEAVRTTLARMLILSGYPVREYSSGAELLAAADGLSGCILLDLNMPDANGIAVNRALKELSIDIPVILMTGAGVGSLPIRPDVGAILQKPFRRADLVSLLDKFGIRPNAEAKQS